MKIQTLPILPGSAAGAAALIITASVVFVFGTIFADLEIPLTVLCPLQPGLCLGNSWDSNNFKNMIYNYFGT